MSKANGTLGKITNEIPTLNGRRHLKCCSPLGSDYLSVINLGLRSFYSLTQVIVFVAFGDRKALNIVCYLDAPRGILGKIADKLLIERHLRNLVQTRNTKLKEIAES